MGIPAKVFDGIAEAVESLLDIRAPVPAVKSVPETLPAGRLPESSTGIREGKGTIFIKLLQECKVFPLEFIPQDKDRQEEGSAAFAEFTVLCKPAAGEDAVHMYMVKHFLVPSMENLDNARLCAEVFFVATQFQQRLRAAPVEETVKSLLVGKDERVELMGKSKNHMEVRSVNDLGPAPVYPDFFLDGLTVRAVTVAAGIMMDFQVAAGGAEAFIASQLSGFAPHDGVGSLTLDVRLRGTGGGKIRIGGKENLLYFEGSKKPLNFFAMHAGHPRSGQRDWLWCRKKPPPGAHRLRWN